MSHLLRALLLALAAAGTLAVDCSGTDVYITNPASISPAVLDCDVINNLQVMWGETLTPLSLSFTKLAAVRGYVSIKTKSNDSVIENLAFPALARVDSHIWVYAEGNRSILNTVSFDRLAFVAGDFYVGTYSNHNGHLKNLVVNGAE